MMKPSSRADYIQDTGLQHSPSESFTASGGATKGPPHVFNSCWAEILPACYLASTSQPSRGGHLLAKAHVGKHAQDPRFTAVLQNEQLLRLNSRRSDCSQARLGPLPSMLSLAHTTAQYSTNVMGTHRQLPSRAAAGA